MAKKVKLKARLQNALQQKQLAQKKARVSGGKPADSSKPPATNQHDPATMTVRHMWSDGRETVTPYRPSRGQHILVIGDGDLSFSVALAELLGGPDARLVTTTLDTREALERKYGPALIASNLSRLPDATILHGVDGTRLLQNKHLARFAYSRVVFNYPHTGAGIKDRDRNIRAQQEMLRAFLASACALLQRQTRLRGPVTRTALTRGKDAPLTGKRQRPAADASDAEDDNDIEEAEEDLMRPIEPEIHVTMRTGDPYDAWQVKGLGASIAGLRSAESFRFEPGKYPGYRHVKTLGEAEEAAAEEEDFLLKPAKTYVFRLKPLT